MKAVVAAFNQEKALVGAFSVITNLRMQLFEALLDIQRRDAKWTLDQIFTVGKGLVAKVMTKHDAAVGECLRDSVRRREVLQ